MDKVRLNHRYSTLRTPVLLVIAVLCVIFLTQGSGAETSATTKTAFVQSEFSGWSNQLVPASDGTIISSYSYSIGDSCRVAMVHEKGTVNVAAKLQQKVAVIADAPDIISIKQQDEKSLTLQTSAGPKGYTLHQYVVKGEKTELGTAFGGQEFAYLPLSNGYIYINGFCKTSDQLPKTIPALEAVTYSPAH